MNNHVLNDGTVLQTGSHYFVKHINSKKSVHRIYKYSERRFGNILCFVFSSKTNHKTNLIKKTDGYYWQGENIPNSEISIPYYDLISCKFIKI